MKKNIQNQINKIQASISYIFIGSLSLYQGIEALSRYLLNKEIDFYGLGILTVGALLVILGEIGFLRAKKKILLSIKSIDSDN